MPPVFITILLVSVAVSSAAPSSRNDETFVHCMSKCLIGGDQHEHVTAVFKICKDSPTCWGEHLGGRVQKCASECKDPAPEEVLVWTALESSSLAASDVPAFVKCMAKCLGKSLEQVEKWYEECKTNTKCWLKKVGFQGLKCAGKCIKEDETATMLPSEALQFSSVSDVPEFVKCMAKCLGKSLEQVEKWYEECKTNAKCWMKKAGLRAMTCAGKCIKGDETTPKLLSDALQFSSVSDVPEFVKCMAKCLGKSLEQVEKWYEECKTNAKCWMKKAGLRAMTCAGKCIKGDETTPKLLSDALQFSSVSDVPEFVKCMAKCLGKSLEQVEKWYEECKTNAKCWLKKVGLRAMTCAGKCIKGDETTPKLLSDALQFSSVSDVPEFVKCMAKCLGKSLEQVEKWYEECKTNAKCWMKKAGLRAMTCAGKCIKGDETTPKLLSDALQFSSVSDVPEFVKCMAKCLGKSLEQVEKWYEECKTNAKCWMKKAGLRAMTCAGKCIKGDETTPKLLSDALQFSSVSDVPEFVKCMAKCLGKSLEQVEKWYEECKTNAKCWMKRVGLQGLKCAGKCIKEDHETTAMVASVGLVEPEENSGFLVCMAKCLGKDIKDIKNIYKECKKKVKCWVKKVGKKALKCVGKCVLSEINMTKEIAVTTPAETAIERPEEDENFGFLLCMAVCIGKDIKEIRQWYKECKKSLKCWFKKAGKKALKCAGKCLLLDEQTSTSTVDTGMDVTAPANFTKCLFHCFMGDAMTILGWYNKCGEDIDCWLKKAWEEGMKCAAKCGGNVSLPKKEIPPPVNNDFLNCMAHCLGKDVSEILEWYNKCHTDIQCWLKEVGFEGLKCAGKCLAEEKDLSANSALDDPPISQSYSPAEGPVNNNFLKCMGECLKKDISEILEWYNKCHTDIGCWLKEAGGEGLKCAGECLMAGEDKDEATLESSPDNNDFLNCMGHCLGKDVSEILEWYNKCHTDIQCWLKEMGFEGLKCAGKCLAEETDSKSVPIAFQSDLVKIASYEKVIQIIKGPKGTMPSRRL